MKENSIEEDITRIKQRIEDVKEYIEYGLSYSEYLDLENSFDNILSDYKRVLKENEEWDRKFCDLQNLYFKLQDESELKRKEYQETYKDVREELKEWQETYKSEKKMKNEYIKLYQDLLLKENVIPIQKVKDKIEELNKAYEDSKDENGESEYYYPDYTIRVLEELLEKRK